MKAAPFFVLLFIHSRLQAGVFFFGNLNDTAVFEPVRERNKICSAFKFRNTRCFGNKRHIAHFFAFATEEIKHQHPSAVGKDVRRRTFISTCIAERLHVLFKCLVMLKRTVEIL